MVFWDILGWGLSLVDMGISLCNSLAHNILHFDYIVIRVIFILLSPVLVHQSYFFFFFCFVESRFGLESLFIVHVESSVSCSPLVFTHDVLIGSFSDMIVLFWVCFTYLVMMCVMLLIWDICHSLIVITLAWHIMEDIEPIDLGSGN